MEPYAVAAGEIVIKPAIECSQDTGSADENCSMPINVPRRECLSATTVVDAVSRIDDSMHLHEVTVISGGYFSLRYWSMCQLCATSMPNRILDAHIRLSCVKHISAGDRDLALHQGPDPTLRGGGLLGKEVLYLSPAGPSAKFVVM